MCSLAGFVMFASGVFDQKAHVTGLMEALMLQRKPRLKG